LLVYALCFQAATYAIAGNIDIPEMLPAAQFLPARTGEAKPVNAKIRL
jgi:hypothetical protein